MKNVPGRKQNASVKTLGQQQACVFEGKKENQCSHGKREGRLEEGQDHISGV